MPERISIIVWHLADEHLPSEPGEYLVTYHPCYWDDVDTDRVEVGMDYFRGKSSWSRKKFQRVIAWAEKPMACKAAWEKQEQPYEWP